MSIVSVSNITKTYGPVHVFDGLSVSFHAGRKTGLIGPNGSGKSTLFRMIVGSESPDTGSLSLQNGLRIGYLPQEPDFHSDKTVFEVMHEGLSDLLAKQDRMEHLSAQLGTLAGKALKQAMTEYDHLARELEIAGGWSSEARIRSVLYGLGLTEEVHHAPVTALSGGQLSRLGLARVLLRDTDLLLLDEPTNHLDLQAICWLETFLRNYTGAVLVVSHDRFLLDQTVDQIVVIENKKAVWYSGNFSQYLELKRQRRLHQQRVHAKRVEFVRKTRDFIARNKDQEGMRKTARGRKKRLDRLLSEQPDFLDIGAAQKTISFRFGKDVRRSENVIQAEGISKSFDDILLFKDLSLDLPRGGRLAITGPNGSGKSTLLKILLGLMAPDKGTVKRGAALTIGYLDQHAHTLNPENTVLEEATGVRPDLTLEALRGRLATFLFRGEQVFQKIDTLSGGQRNRLMLCKLVLSEPDVLILDEPTNHLDIESSDIFEEALLEYPGSVIAVSHDRYFIDRVFRQMLVIGLNSFGQKCTGCTDWSRSAADSDGVYSLWIHNSAGAQQKKDIERAKSKRPHGPSERKTSPKTPPDLKSFNKYSTEHLENEILMLETEMDQLTEQFGSEKVYKNPTDLKALEDQRDRLGKKLSLLYRAYEARFSK